MRLDERVHKAIYAIDNLFDDEPARWKSISAGAPASALQALVMDRPCAMIQRLLNEGQFPLPNVGKIEAMTKGFNALAYIYGKCGEMRDQIDLGQLDDPQMREKLKQYALRNLQASLVARGVMGIAVGEAKSSETMAALSIMLRDDFVGSNMPEAYAHEAEYREILGDIRPGHILSDGVVCTPSKRKFGFDQVPIFKISASFNNLLCFEVLNFHSDDWRDLLADLGVERRTGVPTPNLVASYIRIQHPEIDLQAFAQDVQTRYEGAQRVTVEQIAEVNTTVAGCIQEMVEADSFRRNPQCYISQEAKQLAKSARGKGGD